MPPPENTSTDSKKIEELQKTTSDQANTIARLENEMKKLGDPNASPRIIQKGNQKHPKYQRNKKTISATIQKPREKLPPLPDQKPNDGRQEKPTDTPKQ